MNVDKVKYLSVATTSKNRWTNHVTDTANNIMGYLRQNVNIGNMDTV